MLNSGGRGAQAGAEYSLGDDDIDVTPFNIVQQSLKPRTVEIRS
jgi:hypothetical protein